MVCGVCIWCVGCGILCIYGGVCVWCAYMMCEVWCIMCIWCVGMCVVYYVYMGCVCVYGVRDVHGVCTWYVHVILWCTE